MSNVMKLLKNEVNIQKMNNYVVEYIEEFLSIKRMRSTTSNTEVNYRSDFNMLAKTLFNYDNYKFIKVSDLEELTVNDLILYFKTLHEEGTFSNQTLNRRMSSLKALLNHLVVQDVIDFPVNKMMLLLKSLPKTPERIDVLSIEDADRCINQLLTLPKGNITSLMAKMSIDTGLRANELLTLTWRQFYPKGDTVVIKSVGKIKGKGNKDWKIEISKEFYQELLSLKMEGTEQVFNISYSYLVKLFNKALENLNLDDKNYSFHSFRKRGVTNAYIETKDIQVAKKVANHSSIATTEIYLEELQGGIMGYYSKGNKVDSDLYKKVDSELLYSVLEELGGDFLHKLNMKINNNLQKNEH